jgi:putative endonuclease
MATKDDLGRRGEDVAVEYLQRKGLVVLARNWRCREGELDVVATEHGRAGPRLVVCEIKTRSGTRYGEPAEAVTGRKAQRIRRVTRAWLATHAVPWCEIRFDVVAIVARPGRPLTLRHYVDAF